MVNLAWIKIGTHDEDMWCNDCVSTSLALLLGFDHLYKLHVEVVEKAPCVCVCMCVCVCVCVYVRTLGRVHVVCHAVVSTAAIRSATPMKSKIILID